jgi:hypothetical protein
MLLTSNQSIRKGEKNMTKGQRIEFIKDKLAPLFDGMNAGDVLDILFNDCSIRQMVMSQFTISLCQKED